MSKKIAEYALEVLTEAGWPMHISDLVPKLQKAGWVCGGKSPQQVAYASLHDFIKRRGEESPIKLLPNSMFTTAAVYQTLDPEKWAPTKRERRSRTEGLIIQVKSSIPEDERRCGNCKFIKYSGIEIMHRRAGNCDNPASQRNSVFPNGPRAIPCPYWQARSSYQIAKDDAEAASDRMLARSPWKWAELAERKRKQKARAELRKTRRSP